MVGETLTEAQAGWVTDPVDLTEITAETTPLAPRYAILEQHGDQKQKIRLVGDFRPSEINAIIETEDANAPDSLGVFTALASYFKLIAPRCHLI